MRAQLLWVAWAYLGLVTVVARGVLFITFNVIFIIPKFQRLLRDGMIDSVDLEEQGIAWMVNFLYDVHRANCRWRRAPRPGAVPGA